VVYFGDALPGNVLTKIHDVRLEHPTAHLARGDDEIGGGLEDGVGVGSDLDIAHVNIEAGIENIEAYLHVRPRDPGSAFEADDRIGTAVQIDNAIRARFLVEEIDILGDDAPHVPACQHPSDGVVALVGRDVTHEPVTHVVVGPVVGAECLRTHELLVRHRRAGRGVGAPVIGNAGVGGEPRAGEYRELPPL